VAAVRHGLDVVSGVGHGEALYVVLRQVDRTHVSKIATHEFSEVAAVALNHEKQALN
jgi:hypothetical protein